MPGRSAGCAGAALLRAEPKSLTPALAGVLAERRARELGPSGYDPTQWIQKLSVPVLWLYGGRDLNQPAGTSIELLRGLSVGHDFAVQLFPDASHSLFDERGFPPGLFPAAPEWLRRHGLLATQ